MTDVMQRIETDADSVQRDLAKLLLTVVELVRQLMERQALRRVDAGRLTDEQAEKVGLGLMRLAEAMQTLREHFGIGVEELNLDLGPLGPLLPRDPIVGGRPPEGVAADREVRTSNVE